jgi:hypothetical protein
MPEELLVGLVTCSERAADGTPALLDGEELSFRQPAVRLLVDAAPATPPGTLHVTTRCARRPPPPSPAHAPEPQPPGVAAGRRRRGRLRLSLIHISEPTRLM